jgi:hypothetical protein
MNTSKSIFESLTNKPFSYGEALAVILDNNGKPISTMPEEDFVFPDKSVIRLTNESVKVIQLLQE